MLKKQERKEKNQLNYYVINKKWHEYRITVTKQIFQVHERVPLIMSYYIVKYLSLSEHPPQCGGFQVKS